MPPPRDEEEFKWLEEPLLPSEPASSSRQPGRTQPRSPDDLEAQRQQPKAEQQQQQQQQQQEWQQRGDSAAGWAVVHEVFEEPPPRYNQSSLWDTAVNLTNATIGAGMLAMPHAFAGMGVLGGAGMTLLVALMTYASIAVLLRPTERSGKLTYAAVMEHEWGRWAGLAARVSIVAGSAGFLILYLIVLADLLVGSTEWSGIIPDLWPDLPDPLPWYLGRTAMLTWVMLCVAPTLAPRTLGGVAPISIFSVVCSFLCVAAVVALCAVQAVKGKLPPIHWLPDPAFFGSKFTERLTNVLAVVPVIMTAFVCQMSVHPLVSDLHNYTPRRMRTAVAGSMAASAVLYAAIGLGGLLLWGRAVQGDVLSNLSIDEVADILGGNVRLAMGFVATVKVATALSLIMSFPITIWPMREDIIETVIHSFGLRNWQVTPGAYYAITYASLALIYLAAVCVQSAYTVVGIVGSTCGVSMSFLFPAMLTFSDPQPPRGYRAFGWLLLAAGTVLGAIGLFAS